MPEEKYEALKMPKVDSTMKLPAWSQRIPVAMARSPSIARRSGKPTKEVLPSAAVMTSAPVVDEDQPRTLPRTIKRPAPARNTIQDIETGIQSEASHVNPCMASRTVAGRENQMMTRLIIGKVPPAGRARRKAKPRPIQAKIDASCIIPSPLYQSAERLRDRSSGPNIGPKAPRAAQDPGLC